MKSLAILLLAAFIPARAQNDAQRKPIVFPSGDGLTTVQASGVGGGAHGIVAGSSSASVSKTNAVMELSKGLLKFCPGVDVTLDETV